MMKRRSALVFAVAIVVATALGLALAVAERRVLAERWLLEQLAARGLSPASLRVAEIDARGLLLRDVVIGRTDAPDLAIAALDARWSIDGLRRGQLDGLRVSGLHLRGALGDRGLALGSLDPLLVGGEKTSGPMLLPAPEIDLSEATFVLETPEGSATGGVAGRLNAHADGALAGDFTLQLEHPLARATGTVVISGTLEQLEAELSLALRDGREPARVAPATLTGRVSGALAALDFELALDGANGALHAEASGSADLPARSVEAKLSVAPIAFAADGLQPGALLPALEPLLAELGIAKVAGSVEARGTFVLEAGEPALRLDVALREVGFHAGFARLAGVSGVVAVRAPPLRTEAAQVVSVGRVDAGLTLRGGLVNFQLLPGGVIELRSTTWTWLGGELRAENLRLDVAAESTLATLEARGLDLAELLALAAFEGLEGSGRIDGELPLVRRGNELLVTGGVLRARPGGGTLRYRASEAALALAKSRPNDLGIAVAAFANFHYEVLEARVDGDLRGELRIALHVRGASPDFQNGQPLELNLNLESRLADLVREGVAVYRVPDVVAERLRAFSDKGRK